MNTNAHKRYRSDWACETKTAYSIEDSSHFLLIITVQAPAVQIDCDNINACKSLERESERKIFRTTRIKWQRIEA